jgi:hypothetical protein
VSITDIIAQRPSVSPAADSMTVEQATRLDQETGIAAAIWSEAYDLAGSKEFFDIAFSVWRQSFTKTAIDPRTIVADLRYALDVR